jgi:tetratricopeptide (TPR) repeat protein
MGVTIATEAGSRPPFIGRVETVEALHRRFEDARAGTGGVTLLVGDTGVGKSALVAQLVQDIRAFRTLVLIGRALALDDPPPFSLIRSAIESANDDPSLQSGESRPFGGDPVMIGFAPRFGEGAFPTPVSIEARLLETLGGTSERSDRSRDRVLEKVADQFLEFTRRGPTVLILEDLHHADDSSLATVEFLAKQLENESLWILGTSRPYDSLTESGRARLERFESATRARQMVLRPMTSDEVAEYLRVNDPSREIPSEEVTRLYSETGGNPLLLEQLAHRVSFAGERPGSPGADPLRIDEGAQHVLDTGSVLGPAFTFDLLLRASGGEDEERLTETVDRLVGQGLLFERPGEVLEFPEDRLREETYTELPQDRRRLLHRRAGEALEAVGKLDASGVYALARHFYLGHDAPKSVNYNRIAAEIAERALALDTAWDLYTRALESQSELTPEDPDAEAELVLELARITEELGLLQDAETILRDFLDREVDDPRLSVGRRTTLELFLARVLHGQGDSPAASELAKKVLDTPGVEDQLLVRVGAHHQIGLSLYYEGRYEEALAHHTEGLRLAREVGNEQVILRAQFWRAATLAMKGEMAEAIAEAREVTGARDRLGSVRESAQAHLYLGDILADARCTAPQRQEAIAEYAEAIRFAEQAKDPRRVGYALYKTTELLREAGRFPEALEKVQQACELLGRVGDQVGLSVSLKARGQVAMDQGAYDLAEADLTEAHRLLQGLKHVLEEIDVVLQLAQLAERRGDCAKARRYVTDLERQNLPALRPDLAPEFEHLKQTLAEEKGEGPSREPLGSASGE